VGDAAPSRRRRTGDERWLRVTKVPDDAAAARTAVGIEMREEALE